jgi:hypothetical protein
MNDHTKPMTPAEQLQHELSRLVWVAMDLQQRAAIGEVTEIVYVRIAEITRHTTAIRDLLNTAKAANKWSAAAATTPATDPSEENGETPGPGVGLASDPAPAARPPAKKPKGGAT